jgi:uncharacterized membrane protein (UPF0127 family)
MAFRVQNKANGTVLAHRADQAGSFFARFRGLIARAQFQPGDGLHLIPCQSIHTFFMHCPIDALFLDEGGRVLRVISALRPWRVTPRCPGAISVLELPAGMAAQTGTEAGDELVFEVC